MKKVAVVQWTTLRSRSNDRVGRWDLDTIRQHAKDFIAKREAPAYIANDGKQTPMKGHPVFIAQHATATCCRECIRKWHKIQPGKELSQAQQDYLVDVIMTWIQKEIERQEHIIWVWKMYWLLLITLTNQLILWRTVWTACDYKAGRQCDNVRGACITGCRCMVWQYKIPTTPHNNMTELYFEDNDIEGIIENWSLASML